MSTPFDNHDAAAAGPTMVGAIALFWGLGGFLAIMLLAIVRLSAIAIDSFAYPWHPMHVAAFVANLLFMGWSEGYRGFQCSYSPRLAARALHLFRHATASQAVLAPFVCMGFLHAPRRRIISAWLLTVAIVAVVLVYRALPQPWRGILDAGVVLGLVWGTGATLYWVWRYLFEGAGVDPEVR